MCELALTASFMQDPQDPYRRLYDEERVLMVYDQQPERARTRLVALEEVRE